MRTRSNVVGSKTQKTSLAVSGNESLRSQQAQAVHPRTGRAEQMILLLPASHKSPWLNLSGIKKTALLERQAAQIVSYLLKNNAAFYNPDNATSLLCLGRTGKKST